MTSPEDPPTDLNLATFAIFAIFANFESFRSFIRWQVATSALFVSCSSSVNCFPSLRAG